MYKPIVEVYKTAHGVAVYLCRLFDVAAGIARDVQFLIPADTPIVPMEGQYGQQALVEGKEEMFMDTLEAALEIWRQEVIKKSTVPSDSPIESVSALRGGAVYANWPWKNVDVFNGVEKLVASGGQGILMLNSVNFDKAKNCVTAKLALSQYGQGGRRAPPSPPSVEPAVEVTESPAPVE